MDQPLSCFIIAFIVSGLAGLAALLRSGSTLTFLGVFSSILNSGLLGLGICLLWYVNYQDNVYFLVGICVLAGLGGMTMVDFVLRLIRSGGFSIKMGKDGEVKLPHGEDKK